MCLAIPARIVSTFDREGIRFGTVAIGRVRSTVCLHAVNDANVGDEVIVHVGVAIAKVDPAAAERTRALLTAAGNVK